MVVAVVIKIGGERSIFRFSSAKKLEMFVNEVKKSYPKVEMHLVNCSMATPPPNNSGKRGKLWCPYCTNWRKFTLDERIGTKRCEICGISDRDFYVSRYNSLRGRN